MRRETVTSGRSKLESWFLENQWKPFDFQQQVWDAYLRGESGLIHSATGTGKTLAAWLGPVSRWLDQGIIEDSGLRVLWLTPLRSLAFDTTMALQRPLTEMGMNCTVELRTGDTSSYQRQKQKKHPPTALVTTPESLSLMLTNEDHSLFDNLEAVIVDEWHELLSTKRGVQTELALAHLRALKPDLITWGISATLGNTGEAMESLIGVQAKGHLIRGLTDKEIVIDTLLPKSMHRFPWAGHFGTQMIPDVVEAIEESRSCLIFTNTRAQAEIWFQEILTIRPDWKAVIGLHHGSLDREVREAIEDGLKLGHLRAVVCTSSLDLGVDFTPVDRVIQVGSPKGVARLLQRAGRSGHQPGVPSRVSCVPTHALELMDIAGARKAALEGKIESRDSIKKPLDVLAQHLVTCALGGGFDRDPMLAELRTTKAYESLTDEEFDWALEFIVTGGSSLRAYDAYKRVEIIDDRYVVNDKQIALRQRMSIGTIVSTSSMKVQYLGGGYLGTVEESFVSRLKAGDKFLFAGKALQFLKVKDMTCFVKSTSNFKGSVPRWAGGRMPLSNELAHAIREELDSAKQGIMDGPEMMSLVPILEIQNRWSAIPEESEFLIESCEDREGHHLFFFPIDGRLVHEGLAALFAYRIGRIRPITLSMAFNDYGFELLSADPIPLQEAIDAGLFALEGLAEDIMASLNSIEMARRQFREIAQIGGLIFANTPGVNKSVKNLQASSGLFFDVFSRFDPENMLLKQAYREVLERQLEESRLRQVLKRLGDSKLLITYPPRPTPLAFPILVDRLRETMSTESMGDRIEKMALQLEQEAQF